MKSDILFLLSFCHKKIVFIFLHVYFFYIYKKYYWKKTMIPNRCFPTDDLVGVSVARVTRALLFKMILLLCNSFIEDESSSSHGCCPHFREANQVVDSNVLFGRLEERGREGFWGEKYIKKWGNLLYFWKSNFFENHKLVFRISIFLILEFHDNMYWIWKIHINSQNSPLIQFVSCFKWR